MVQKCYILWLLKLVSTTSSRFVTNTTKSRFLRHIVTFLNINDWLLISISVNLNQLRPDLRSTIEDQIEEQRIRSSNQREIRRSRFLQTSGTEISELAETLNKISSLQRSLNQNENDTTENERQETTHNRGLSSNYSSNYPETVKSRICTLL